MQAESELEVVESGDHSLLATQGHLRAAGLKQEDIDARVLAAIDAFTRGLS